MLLVPGSALLFHNHYPGFTGAPSCRFRTLPRRPPSVDSGLTGLVGLLMRDMVLTNDEVVGLRDGLLTSGDPPTGTTRLSDWLAQNGDGLGRRYVSELRRNYRR